MGQLKQVHFHNINICEAEVESSDKAGNLEVILRKKWMYSHRWIVSVNQDSTTTNLPFITSWIWSLLKITTARAFETSTLDYDKRFKIQLQGLLSKIVNLIDLPWHLLEKNCTCYQWRQELCIKYLFLLGRHIMNLVPNTLMEYWRKKNNIV